MAAIRSIGADLVREMELSENLDGSERVAHLETSEPLDPRLVESLAVDGLTPGPYVTDAIAIGDASLRLRRHVLSFFQGNRHLLSTLVAHVAERVPVGSKVLDLYVRRRSLFSGRRGRSRRQRHRDRRRRAGVGGSPRQRPGRWRTDGHAARAG